jgi:hypothetical protein
MQMSSQLHAPGALLYGESPWHPLDTNMSEPQSRSGHCAQGKRVLPRLESDSNPSVVQPAAVITPAPPWRDATGYTAGRQNCEGECWRFTGSNYCHRIVGSSVCKHAVLPPSLAG